MGENDNRNKEEDYDDQKKWIMIWLLGVQDIFPRVSVQWLLQSLLIECVPATILFT